jgi:hypothetical protein
MAIEIRSVRVDVPANSKRYPIMELQPSMEERFKIIAVGGSIEGKGVLRSYVGETQLDEIVFGAMSDMNHPIPRNFEISEAEKYTFEFDEESGTTNTVVLGVIYDRIPT